MDVISQSPAVLRPLPTRLSIPMTAKTNQQRRLRHRYLCPTSVTTISVLVFIAILLVGSITTTTTTTTTSTTTSGFVGALLQPDPIAVTVRTRRITTNAEAILPPQGSSFSSISTITPTASRTTTALWLANENNDNKKKKKAQGVYVRPSGAIEQGSGFFVPGLEGPKVRLAIGLVLLGGTAINHFGLGVRSSRSGIDEILSFSEITAILYSVLLLFQSAIEYAKEALPEASQGEASSSSRSASAKFSVRGDIEVLEQKWSTTASDDDPNESSYRSRVQWAAASYVSMTPTTQIMLLAGDGATETPEGGVQYRLGGRDDDSGSSNTAGPGVRAALDELRKSKGGRIALPLTHPAVEALLVAPTSDANTSAGTGGETSGGRSSSRVRTVILQRITDGSCWMVASDQLLAGYTSGDLKWLGKLAGYVTAVE